MKALKYKDDYERDTFGKIIRYRNEKIAESDMDWMVDNEGKKYIDFKIVDLPLSAYDA